MEIAGRGEILNVKNSRYWKLYWLFRDKKFINESLKIKQNIMHHFPKDKSFFNFDADVLAEAVVPKNQVAKIDKLATKYNVSPWVIRNYLNGYIIDNRDQVFNPVSASSSVKDGWIVLKMGPSITQEKFRELWGMVEMSKEDLVGKDNIDKRELSSQTNFELIYYIERGLSNGLSLKEITDLYNDGDLPGYDHKVGERAYSIKELKYYYNKHKFVD